MHPELLPLAITAGAVLLTVIVVGTVLRRKGRRLAEELTPAFELGTVRPLGALRTGLEGLYRGYTCRYLIRYASQHDRGGATLKIDAGSPISWSAEREELGTRLLLSLGLVRDLEVGHPELDDRFRFAADDPGAFQATARIETFRAALRDLASMDNFESVRARNERFEIVWSPRSAELDEDPGVLRRRLEAAVALLAATGSPPRLRAPI